MTESTGSNHVAVIGAGPAGFFAAEALLKHPNVKVDLFERLPAPYGLVRYGVAPDHQKIKSVEAGFAKVGSDPRVRYFGNVALGRDLSTEELLEHYDQIVYAMGCEAPQRLGIPGEHLPGVHTALEMVSWYNGHPDYVDSKIRLDVTDVVVVGAGDVSMDLSRLLASTPAELAVTDMAPGALAAFGEKRVRRVHLVIRRGPAQAGFAHKELQAVLDRDDVMISCDRELLELTLSDPELPKAQRGKLSALLERSRSDAPKPIEVRFHFLRSPVEFVERDERLVALRVEKSRLEAAADGSTVARGTGEFEELPCGLALLAVGYRGSETTGVRLDPRSGLVPNVEGQLLRVDGSPDPRCFVVGWLKRGPQGVIGTNKGDAKATVARMLENLPAPAKPVPPVDALLHQRGIRFITFDDWLRLDAIERAKGAETGKPREKFTSVNAALEALGTP